MADAGFKIPEDRQSQAFDPKAVVRELVTLAGGAKVNNLAEALSFPQQLNVCLCGIAEMG